MLVNVGPEGCFSPGNQVALLHLHVRGVDGQQVIEDCCEQDYWAVVKKYRRDTQERC